MKRFAFALGVLLTLPAFAEVMPVYYDELAEYPDGEYMAEIDVDLDELATDEDNVEKTSKKSKVNAPVGKPIGKHSGASRVVASRNVPSGNNSGSGRGNTNAAAGRVVASRAATNNSSRVVNSGAPTTRGTTKTAQSTRAASTRATGGATISSSTRATSTRSSSKSGSSVARSAVLKTGVGGANSGRVINVGDDNLYNDTNTLYKANRVGVRGATSSSGVRGATIRSGTTPTLGVTSDTVTVVDNSADMDALAELTDYCKAQYANCMDNYCNVLDDNQGRCSCSGNLKNYAKSEETLKNVTNELKEVAQKIQYIGLSGREVDTLFNQTEGELQMQSKTDNSQLKTSLDKIKNMIVGVQSGTSSSSGNSDVSFDLSGLLDFSIDSTGFDLTAFMGGNNTSSINNQRGEQLYKTATARCKANVLNSCSAQGVDPAIVTNSYDLEIDKQCIAYERSLKDSNDQMEATVRNAKAVLQKARLLVSQQKNEYDMRGCVNELNNCMQDEFVCGSDYEKCLDPTGRYIVDGSVVIGSQPGRPIDSTNSVWPNTNGTNSATATVATSNPGEVAIYATWNYGNKNAWGLYGGADSANGNLADYIDGTLAADAATLKINQENMSKYLQNKIGYNVDGINYGMCMSVLNKCQNYTYEVVGNKSKFKFKNDVIKHYLSRVLVQIKAKQDEVLNEYAENCITEVNSCLSQNNYPVTSGETYNATQANIAINACRSNIITCMSVNGYSVGQPTPVEMANWVAGTMGMSGGACTAGTLQGCQTAAACTGVGGIWSVNTSGVGTCSTTNTEACYIDRQGYNLSSAAYTLSSLGLSIIGSDPVCTGSLAQCVTAKPTNKLCFYHENSGDNYRVYCVPQSYTPSESTTVYKGFCYDSDRNRTDYDSAHTESYTSSVLTTSAGYLSSSTVCEKLGGTIGGTSENPTCSLNN